MLSQRGHMPGARAHQRRNTWRRPSPATTSKTDKFAQFKLYSGNEIFENTNSSEIQTPTLNTNSPDLCAKKSNVRKGNRPKSSHSESEYPCNSVKKEAKNIQKVQKSESTDTKTAKTGLNKNKRIHKQSTKDEIGLPVISQHLSKAGNKNSEGCLDVFEFREPTRNTKCKTVLQQKRANLQVLLSIYKTQNELETLRDRRHKLAASCEKERLQGGTKEE